MDNERKKRLKESNKKIKKGTTNTNTISIPYSP
jgi:hypothetical protein